MGSWPLRRAPDSQCVWTGMDVDGGGGGLTGCVVESLMTNTDKLTLSDYAQQTRDVDPMLHSRSRRFERSKNVSSPSIRKTQCCGGPPWPRGSVLGLRPPGFEYRILCLESSVISLISPSSGGSPCLYVHKSGLKPDTFYFWKYNMYCIWWIQTHFKLYLFSVLTTKISHLEHKTCTYVVLIVIRWANIKTTYTERLNNWHGDTVWPSDRVTHTWSLLMISWLVIIHHECSQSGSKCTCAHASQMATNDRASLQIMSSTI